MVMKKNNMKQKDLTLLIFFQKPVDFVALKDFIRI
jgi:hypothetical protein